MKFPWGFDFTVSDRYTKSRTPPDFEGDTKDDYHYNDFVIEGAYHLGSRYKVVAGYRNVLKEFFKDRNEDDNFIRNGGYGALYYRIMPKTHVFAEYTYYQMDNEDPGRVSTDNENHQIWAGVEWEPRAKIKGIVKGGYSARRYDKDEVGEDEDTFGAEGDLTYSMSNYTDFHLQVERQFVQSEVTREEGPYGAHYIRTGGELGMTYRFPFWSRGMHEFEGTAAGFYYNEDWRPKQVVAREREDDNYGGKAEFSYTYWERLSFSLGYRYENNESNIDVEDYTENRVYGQVSLVF
jgi:hypothetical protein